MTRRLAALLHTWDDVEADELFTDNVAHDDSYARRRAAVDALVGGRWPLALGTVTASTDAAAHAELTAADGTAFELRLDLAPLRPVRIESWSFSAATR